ncbi:hypothetical protein ACYSNR_10605 [Enterococcus sp. LJL128]|uniref:hypothetical protein n=1 Tax=Enterococcus sp. LJL51 TaxID=3416656 RepID=UPI003CEC1A3D
MRNVWLARLMKWNMKLQKYMRGRYGQFDKLSRGLLLLSLVLVVGNMFLGYALLRALIALLLILVYYRFFSKKIYVRANENQKFTHWLEKIQKKFNRIKERFQHRKTHTYFSCPECRQQLRAPKHKGQIKITCSNCKAQFIKKV